GGGVALNGVANARLLTETGFTRLYVPPAPGDAGCALGAALYADRILFGHRHHTVPDHPFWGPEIDHAALARLAEEDDFPPEHADRFFELPPGGARLARFMSGVVPVRPEWRERLAAVTHVDGTARVQVLEPEMAPRLARLLEAYGRVSGVPVLLNTSFNLAGE